MQQEAHMRKCTFLALREGELTFWMLVNPKADWHLHALEKLPPLYSTFQTNLCSDGDDQCKCKRRVRVGSG